MTCASRTPAARSSTSLCPRTPWTQSFFEDGKMFDGSSIAGWKGINESDMVLMPDPTTAVLDPFFEETTLIIRCDVLEPATMQGYERDPRSIAKRAEAYLKSTGIGDNGAVRSGKRILHLRRREVTAPNMQGRSSRSIPSKRPGSRARPMKAATRRTVRASRAATSRFRRSTHFQDIRSAMCLAIEEMGMKVEVHHHEVATAGQCEIGVNANTLVKKADEVQLLKYAIHNVAHAYGKTVTFMPKPLVGDNGSGMHVHMSISKDGKPMFAGDKYAGLSDMALYYIGGIIKHAKAINAFTNPSTNSYKRLVPGFEAPVMLAYSARNRSASIRIPWVSNPKARRIEVRFPDSTANPYLAFAAMMMAGLDGIQNKIHPGEAADKDLYDLPPEEAKNIPEVCYSLEQALQALDADRGFLKAGGVFTDDVIDAYIALKMQEVTKIRMSTHPLEFELYYSV